jgi:YegS/Rv2252/BmrU family lipid kinase
VVSQSLAEPGRYQRVLAVINPATKTNPDKIEAMLRAGAPNGIDLDIRFSEASGRVSDLLGDDLRQADVVIAAGGDGTVAAVATAIGDLGIPLGIIPAGSTNIIAGEQRIPSRTDDAVRLIFGPHQIKALDVGICGDRRFIHMAGAGIDSRLFLGTNSALKRRVGWVAYLQPGLRSVFAPPSRFTIRADGARIEVESPLVLVANGTSILKRFFPAYHDVQPDDGLLDVLVVTSRNPVHLARAATRLITRTLARSPFVTRLQARTIEIDADPPLPVELDGDVVTETPVRISISPGALKLIVPAR